MNHSVSVLALQHQTQRRNLELELASRLTRTIQMSSLDLRKSLLRRKLSSAQALVERMPLVLRDQLQVSKVLVSP